MVDGSGRPDEDDFQDAAKTLFPLAYVMKFLVKGKNPDHDYVVMPMEVQWNLDRLKKGSRRFRWTMMIMQPSFVTEETLAEAKQVLLDKKKELPKADSVRIESIEEGICAQIMHIGPTGEPMDEHFNKMVSEIRSQGYDTAPDAHDIYFSDYRRTAPEKLKTLMRIKIWKKDYS